MVITTAAVAGLAACSGSEDDLLSKRAKIVYGTDDRTEYFDAPSEDARALMANAHVALVPRSAVRADGERLVFEARTWGETGGLCPGERFADQPAAAFCTGVLVDWDLIVTAGHCVHLLALQDFWVVFGYYYDAPGHIAAGAGDLVAPAAVVADALDPAGVEPRLDYAWIRLAHRAPPPRRPVAVRRSTAPLAAGDSVLAVGAIGGTPLKLAPGGTVRDARPESLDYFVAASDTAHGSSGGGGLDRERALAGVLVRGGADLVPTDQGCNATSSVSDPAAAKEQFTYPARAVEGLCRTNAGASSLCRAECGEPCQALPPPPETGCSLAAGACRRSLPSLSSTAIAVAIAAAARRRRRAHRRSTGTERDEKRQTRAHRKERP